MINCNLDMMVIVGVGFLWLMAGIGLAKDVMYYKKENERLRVLCETYQRLYNVEGRDAVRELNRLRKETK